MLIVTGMPRSGTSLMMRILNALGLNIAGERHTLTSTEEFNPGGIWEVRNTVYDGIKEPIEGKDAIKLMMSGIERTPAEIIDKVIFCLRDPREVIVSMRGQRGEMKGKELDYNNWVVLKQAYRVWFELVVPEDWPHILVVNYHKLIEEPGVQVNRIATFLDLEPTKKAIDLIEPRLHRARRDKVPLSQQRIAKHVREYYRIMKEKA